MGISHTFKLDGIKPFSVNASYVRTFSGVTAPLLQKLHYDGLTFLVHWDLTVNKHIL
jgi:hypothetical protein